MIRIEPFVHLFDLERSDKILKGRSGPLLQTPNGKIYSVNRLKNNRVEIRYRLQKLHEYEHHGIAHLWDGSDA